MTTYPEERVLKALDPIPEDVNEWPDFALREVKIFYQGKGRYADLLDAAEEVPLCVLGELMPLEDEHEHLALLDDATYARMKIENVTNYSFGQNDDGKPVIWAAGKAGWYEITPADRYLSHYNDTAEAIDMFYFMVDQYQKLSPKRKRLGFLVDPFLRNYQKHTDYRIDDDDEAVEILHKHHKFLLKQMIEEREDIDWSQTHLWKFFVESYGEEIEEMRTKLTLQGDAEMEVDLDSSVDEDTDQNSSEDGSSRDESPQIASAKSVDLTEDSEDSGESDEDEEDKTDWTKPVWSMLNVLRKMPTFDMKNAGIDDIAEELTKLPEYTGSHKSALAAIERSAEPLLRLMNEAKLRKKFNWSTRAIYAELEATLADEVAEDVRTPAPKASRKKHRLKSVLRPSGASKANKRTSSMPMNEENDSDEDEVVRNGAAELLPAGRQQRMMNGHRGTSPDSGGSRTDSPSRQLNGHADVNALPELPPGPEAQEMIDLVRAEAKKHGRVNQVSHLQALLGGLNSEF